MEEGSAHSTTRLFVGGLAADVSEDALLTLFGAIAPNAISRVEFQRKNQDTLGQIFAYLTVEDPSAVSKLVGTLNKTRWKGHELRIAIAKPDYIARKQQEIIAIAEAEKEKEQQIKKYRETQTRADQGERIGDWVRGPSGRWQPLLNLIDKSGTEPFVYDPSHYKHQVRYLDRGPMPPSVKVKPVLQLTREITTVPKSKRDLFEDKCSNVAAKRQQQQSKQDSRKEKQAKVKEELKNKRRKKAVERQQQEQQLFRKQKKGDEGDKMKDAEEEEEDEEVPINLQRERPVVPRTQEEKTDSFASKLQEEKSKAMDFISSLFGGDLPTGGFVEEAVINMDEDNDNKTTTSSTGGVVDFTDEPTSTATTTVGQQEYESEEEEEEQVPAKETVIMTSKHKEEEDNDQDSGSENETGEKDEDDDSDSDSEDEDEDEPVLKPISQNSGVVDFMDEGDEAQDHSGRHISADDFSGKDLTDIYRLPIKVKSKSQSDSENELDDSGDDIAALDEVSTEPYHRPEPVAAATTTIDKREEVKKEKEKVEEKETEKKVEKEEEKEKKKAKKKEKKKDKKAKKQEKKAKKKEKKKEKKQEKKKLKKQAQKSNSSSSEDEKTVPIAQKVEAKEKEVQQEEEEEAKVVVEPTPATTTEVTAVKETPKLSAEAEAKKARKAALREEKKRKRAESRADKVALYEARLKDNKPLVVERQNLVALFPQAAVSSSTDASASSSSLAPPAASFSFSLAAFMSPEVAALPASTEQENSQQQQGEGEGEKQGEEKAQKKAKKPWEEDDYVIPQFRLQPTLKRPRIDMELKDIMLFKAPPPEVQESQTNAAMRWRRTLPMEEVEERFQRTRGMYAKDFKRKHKDAQKRRSQVRKF